MRTPIRSHSSRSLHNALRGHALGVGVGATILLALSGSAVAQESSPNAEQKQAAEERPKMNLSVAPEGPPVQRSDYVHNGFYLRLGVGPSFMYSSLRNKELDATTDAPAFAVSSDLLIGGSPSPGMALGGGALIHLVPSADFDQGKEFLFHFTAGPFFDAFPNDRKGFHLGTLVGLSGLSVNDTVGTLLGGGGAAWLGYDMWVAPEWSAGFQLQMGGSFHGGSDYTGAVFHTSLMISILNH